MFSFLSSLISFLMYWMFLYVGSFLLMIVAIFYMIKSNPTPPTPIIHQHYSTVQVVEPPKRVLIEEEICRRFDGCPIVNNVCVDCLKNQWGLLTGDDGVGFSGFYFTFNLPFTHFPRMLPFLSYSVMFQNVPSLNSPTYSFSKREVSVP